MSRLNNIRHIVGETILAKRNKKGGIRNGNSRNGIEIILSNRPKIPFPKLPLVSFQVPIWKERCPPGLVFLFPATYIAVPPPPEADKEDRQYSVVFTQIKLFF